MYHLTSKISEKIYIYYKTKLLIFFSTQLLYLVRNRCMCYITEAEKVTLQIKYEILKYCHIPYCHNKKMFLETHNLCPSKNKTPQKHNSLQNFPNKTDAFLLNNTLHYWKIETNTSLNRNKSLREQHFKANSQSFHWKSHKNESCVSSVTLTDFSLFSRRPGKSRRYETASELLLLDIKRIIQSLDSYCGSILGHIRVIWLPREVQKIK